MNTEKILVSRIHLDPNQPRETYDGIESLTESIRNKGFMESGTVSVRPHPEIDGEFMVIVGHRRTMASQKAGLESIPCFVYEGLSDKEIYEMQLVENENRKDLSPMNRVRAIQKGIEKEISLGRLARIHGVSVKTLEDDLKLINLAPALHAVVDKGTMPKEVARKLATEFSDQNEQVHVYKNILDGKKTASAMNSAIDAYVLKKNQQDLFSNAQKNAGENGGLKQARKAFTKIQNAAASFAKKNLGDLNVINANKRNISEIIETAKLLEKIAKTLLADAEAFKARKEINQPVVAEAVNA